MKTIQQSCNLNEIGVGKRVRRFPSFAVTLSANQFVRVKARGSERINLHSQFPMLIYLSASACNSEKLSGFHLIVCQIIIILYNVNTIGKIYNYDSVV